MLSLSCRTYKSLCIYVI